MRKYFDCIIELITNFIKGNLILGVYAEEKKEAPKKEEKTSPSTPEEDKKGESASKPADNTAGTTINFEDLISKARKEEKEKLYPQITSLKTKVDELTEKSNGNLLTIEQKDKEIKRLEGELEKVKDSKVETESETVKRLQGEIKDLKANLEKAEKNKVDKTELENSIRDELKNEYEIKLYRIEKINSPEYRDSIIPELVMGTSKEEVDNSLVASKQRYEEITNSVLTRENVKLSSGNINTGSLNTKEFTIDDIMNLDPRSDEYAEFRKKMGLK